jgi:MFS family permease
VWALLFGVALLMLGNGLQGSLLGIRAAEEGFHSRLIGWIMAGFFMGFLLGSGLTPRAINRVGHIRVFAALAATASIVILLHAVLIHPLVWALMRFLTGLCYAGIFVVAESWLNNSADNTTRGRLLGLYMVTTFLGMGGGQLLLNLGDPSSADLFILASILISFSVIPMLLSAAPAPGIHSERSVGLRRLYRQSPLGMVGTFAAGITNGSVFGMGAVYATAAGLSVSEVALFMGILITGGAVFQYPLGKISDRFDRHTIIIGVSFAAAAIALAASMARLLPVSLTLAFAGLFGGLGLTNHSLCIAHANDSIDSDEILAASSTLVLVLGVGSIIGPVIVGYSMDLIGPPGFFLFLTIVHIAIGLFALHPSTRSVLRDHEEQSHYVAVPTQTSSFSHVVAEEYSAEQSEHKES